MTEKVATFQLTLSKTDDGREIYIHAEARMVAPALATKLDKEYLLNLIKLNQFDHFQRNDENIDELVVALAETLERVTSEEDVQGLSFDTNSIAYAVDAEAEVEIPSDKLTATLRISPAKGGEPMCVEKAKAILEEKGVTYGIDNEKLTALIESSQSTTEEWVEDQIAFALDPVNGQDAQFNPLVPTANERILKPKLKEDGTVDMHDLGDLPTVKAGTHLMRREPPTEGESGINVCWEFIKPEKGKDKALKPGSGTEISQEDPDLLIASISGQPNLLDSTMKVDDAVQVKAVDLNTGNMVLDANLLVKGDICEGMTVESEGDITVGGVIESANVKAKGNIIVGKGIIGKPNYDHKEISYSVKVEAEGDISAMFASYAKLRTRGCLHIAEQLLHCDSTAEAEVKVGNEKTVGSQIVGGITRSSEGISADILGASAGVATHLDLSGKITLKQYEIACNRSIIRGREAIHHNMSDALSKFMTLPANPERQERVKKIRNTIAHLTKLIADSEHLEKQLKKEADELAREVQVHAKHKIQPNVILKIGHAKYQTQRNRESGKLYYKDGEIKYEPANVTD